MIMETKKPVNIMKDNISGRRIFISCVFFILNLSISMIVPYPILSEGEREILIINSNLSVKKYSQMQYSFKANFEGSTTEIDIGSKWFDEQKVEKTIQGRKHQVIFCIGSKAYILASEMAKDADIIFSLGINWQRFPLTDKTYVITSEPMPMMELTMYRYFFPEIKKIGVIYSLKHNKEWFQTAAAHAKDTGIEILGVPVKDDKEVTTALQKLKPKADALWLISDPVVLSSVERVKEIFEFCDMAKKPIFTYDRLFAGFGASLIISADIVTMGEQAAKIANGILLNKEMPEKIQNPAGSHIAINLNKIERYGIKLNPKALSSINEFIE